MLFGAIAVLTVFFWPEDFFLNKSVPLIWAFAYWRLYTFLGSVIAILAFDHLWFMEKYPNFFFGLLVTADMVIAGYFFGGAETVSYPWFDFMCFIVPMYSLVMSVNFVSRLAIVNFWTATFVTMWLQGSNWVVDYHHLKGSLSLWLTVNALVLIIGHSIYYFDYDTFKNDRKIQHQQQEIQDLAHHDQLTGLLTRSRFEEAAKNLLEASERYRYPVTMVMMDLDDFKVVNDRYGHSAGDTVLESTGEILESELRKSDLSCRYGGEEFCILMPETDVNTARIPIERIRRSLAEKEFSTDDGGTFSVSCSLGLSELDREDRSFSDLYSDADEALYQAKESGGNCIVTA
ncbi:MAG: GGDEF domain-containing protein [bacterium]